MTLSGNSLCTLWPMIFLWLIGTETSVPSAYFEVPSYERPVAPAEFDFSSTFFNTLALTILEGSSTF